MVEVKKKYHLVTRSDMDGLVSAALLKHMNLVNEITFVHPRDVQDGKIELGAGHITTSLPYCQHVHLCIDHHSPDFHRVKGSPRNLILDPASASSARVVYNHFGGATAFPKFPEEMLAAVDKDVSARFTLQDVLNPAGWELLCFIMDARTGLGKYHDFKVSNTNLFMDLVDQCRKHPIETILNLPAVKERTDLYFSHQEQAREQIKRCTTLHKNLAVVDLRKEETVYATNRFMVYALYPECNISIHMLWGTRKQNVTFAVGKSIFTRTSGVDVGQLMREYGGGGHRSAGTCQAPNSQAEKVRQELIRRTTNGNGENPG
jgi:nanoRNase/pAp phosphatase (c-di-AMP/oligoRNAs hydrolase)